MTPNRTLLALALGAAVITGSAVASASSRADRNIVGAWKTVVTIVDCQTGQPVGAPPVIGLSTFNLGGTMSEWGIGPGGSPAQRSPSHGVWERDRGWQQYSFSFTHYRYGATGALIGSQKVVADAELAENGDTYTSIAAVDILDVSNNVVAAICATSVGTRIE
jgi:hypothetical protein